MPVSFLNEEQERRYGRYAGEPAPEQLARYFHLDDADRAFVAGRRGAHMRLGFAVQLGTVRFLGTFLEQPAEVPAQAVAFMAGQLGIQAAGLLAEYAGSEWRWNHPAEIRDRYGYRAFSEPFVQFRLNRWLYALCWTGSDRPSALFDRATAWLIAHKVLLPGVTTLERSIARVRARAAQRLWRQMLAGITADQTERLEALLVTSDGRRQSPLDRLRDGPALQSAAELARAVARLDEVRLLAAGLPRTDRLPRTRALALDADTGKIKWHYQHTPNDPFDYDSVSENVQVDAPVNGKPIRMALTADRNGFGYAVDRANGEFIWGTPFVKRLTWTKGLNPETGKPVDYDPNQPVQHYVASVTPSRQNPEADICPGSMGGKNWPPTAYNPGLHLWYIPVIESCNHIKVEETKPGSFKPREFYTGGGPRVDERITGSVTVIDVTTGKIAGKTETPYPMLGGLLATPDLVFAGSPDGEVFALDAKSLDKLWSFDTGAGVNAPPVTFTIDGKQYVAILVGMGGAWDKWWAASTPELKSQSPSSMLYVFSL